MQPSQVKVSPSAANTQNANPAALPPNQRAAGGPGAYEFIVTWLSTFVAILFWPLALCVTVKIVREYERAVIFRMGRIRKGGARGPGTFFILPCIDEYKKVDLRTVTYDIPAQSVLTKDSLTIVVDAIIYYRVFNPVMAIASVANYIEATRFLASTTLRNALGVKTLAEILSERDVIARDMQVVLDAATDPWGMKVERVEIKDVGLPGQLQRALAAEAEAQREANAKVISAEGEMKASLALKKASDEMSGAPGALQLRYLQTLNTISAGNNETIVFPLPIEVLRAFSKS